MMVSVSERLAQLVERYIDIVEATGSSPVSLTRRKYPICLGYFRTWEGWSVDFVFSTNLAEKGKIREAGSRKISVRKFMSDHKGATSRA